MTMTTYEKGLVSCVGIVAIVLLVIAVVIIKPTSESFQPEKLKIWTDVNDRDLKSLYKYYENGRLKEKQEGQFGERQLIKGNITRYDRRGKVIEIRSVGYENGT